MVVEAGEFRAFPDALRFILGVKATGIAFTASSSKNAGLLLKQIRLGTFAAERGLRYGFVGPDPTPLNLFDAGISGRDFEQGEPHPMTFLTAAEELGFEPEACFVVEDATSRV